MLKIKQLQKKRVRNTKKFKRRQTFMNKLTKMKLMFKAAERDSILLPKKKKKEIQFYCDLY